MKRMSGARAVRGLVRRFMCTSSQTRRLASACSSAAPGRLDASATSIPETAGRAELTVDSQYPGPVTVYVVTRGLRQRLGMVTACRSVRLVLPPSSSDGAGWCISWPGRSESGPR